jgi:hypothetical protein
MPSSNELRFPHALDILRRYFDVDRAPHFPPDLRQDPPPTAKMN